MNYYGIMKFAFMKFYFYKKESYFLQKFVQFLIKELSRLDQASCVYVAVVSLSEPYSQQLCVYVIVVTLSELYSQHGEEYCDPC